MACGNPVSIVRDSRPADGLNTIRRRRRCENCEERWTTFELRLPQGDIHLRAGMVFTLIPTGELVPIASVPGLEDTLARLEEATRSIREGLLGLGSAPPSPRSPWPPAAYDQ